MTLKKTHKTKKNKKMHGKGMGSHGWGARKKHKKSGHRGGSGMAGTGKRGDQKKTLITKLYGGDYFGKKGITSRGTKRDKRDRITIMSIESNIEKYLEKGVAKQTPKGIEINLKSYKILSSSKDYKIKNKLIIIAKDASKTAVDFVKKAGGDIILSAKIKKEEKKVEKKVKSNKDDSN